MAFSIVDKKGDSSLSFLFLGDYGWPGKNQTEVANQMSIWSSNSKASFVIGLGDNFYHNGVNGVNDKQWNDSFHNIYHHDSLTRIPFYAILGNHDYHQQPQAEIDYYHLHNPHMRIITSEYGWCSDWDPDTKLVYVVRKYTGEFLQVSPFA